jgi:tetratricopeptide (TPR) repeat protein
VPVALVAGIALWIFTGRPGIGDRARSTPRPAPASVGYIGSGTCRSCHTAEYDSWAGSHHSQAMQVAEPERVLGDFGNAQMTYAGVTSTFFRRSGGFWVRTDDAGGTLQDFQVKYTFGVSPLQQYLIEAPGGRVQALSIAWDTRTKEQGGQRWFHLYPEDRITHTDELHWTGRHQNWNFMCADCHSTNVRKGYDAAQDRFQTTWSEINVACESCHGPGSRHESWARTPKWLRYIAWNDNGLTVHLTERRGAGWIVDPTTLVPKRSEPRTTTVEINVCAQCHSRRDQISEQYAAGAPFEDHYVPALMTPGLYYPDGQQRDEVFTYGSFAQSRMAHAGVTCSDCHEPHSQRVRAPGNQLCAQCHPGTRYETPAHHFHPAQTPGAECVSCHMPPTNYMLIDARRDHSIRIPRPDRSVSMGVPNACTGCHRDRKAEWAAAEIRARYGHEPAGFQIFAEAFHADESDDPAAADALARVAGDPSQPAIVRASSLARLANRPGRAAVEAARRHLGDPDASVRRAASMVFEALPLQERLASVTPLLRDPVRSVRVEAAWLLAPASAALAGSPDAAAFSRAADEFIASRRYRADRPEDRTTLGYFFSQLDRIAEAKAEYQAARRLSAQYVPAYVNLSDLQRREGSEAQAEQTLREGLAVQPDDAILHHALGMSLVRSGRHSQAMLELKRAAELTPSARFSHDYGVALHSAGRVSDAVRTLETALARAPRDRDLLFALATFHRDAGKTASALEFAVRLQAAHPDDPEAETLVRSLKEPRANTAR